MEMAETHEEPKSTEVIASKKTIFVRNLPFDTTNKQLEEIFSDEAPIKQAFVVKDRDNHLKCRGFGYVHFVLQDDAEKALESNKTFKKRKLILCYANKKPKHGKRKTENQSTDNSNLTDKSDPTDASSKCSDVEVKEETNVANDQTSKTQSEKKACQNKSKQQASKVKNENTKKNESKWTDNKTAEQRTIVVTGLTAEVKLTDLKKVCGKFGEIEKVEFPVKGREQPTAFVQYKDYRNAIRAVQKLPGMKTKKSNVLSSVLLTKEEQRVSKKTLGKSRIIIRNLSFKCEEDDLRETFSKFGTVVDIRIPTKVNKNNKTVKVGCAFVQFKNPANGKVAIDEMNLKEIKGRKIVVDWAVDKKEYTGSRETQVKEENENEEDKKEDNDSDGEEQDEEVDSDGEGSASQQESDDEIVESENEASAVDKDDDDQDGEQSIDDDQDGEQSSDDDQDGEQSSDADDGAEDDEDEDDEDEERKSRMKLKKKDAKEGKTIFLRNLSYNTEEEALEEEFEKYGEIDYCMIVHDKGTGHSKGCAFVKFKEKQSAEKCIEAVEKLTVENKSLVIDGRSVVVAKAMTRGKVEELEKQKASEKKETDKRNLYLAYEGVITSKSPGAEGLSEADLKRREKALEEKKTKLKNPQYFVSRTRLCVRNLPLSCDANEFREKFFEQLNDDESSSIKVTDVKIMRNKERKDVSGQSRSLGYGFIELDTHEGALQLLRATNNNPEVFGTSRRPIVEFSVENSKALKILELKRQKIEKFQSRKENGNETLGRKEFDDDDKRKVYKTKAREQRYKRQVRYQKKREEKRKQKPSGDTTDTNNNNNNNKTNNKSHLVAKRDKSAGTEKTAKHQDNGLNRNKMASSEGTVMTSGKRHVGNDDVEDNLPTSGYKRARNTKSKTEEAKFTTLVEQYKSKLNATSVKTKKKKNNDRWFE